MARPSTSTAPKPAAKDTPLNRQYNQIKAKYPGALLLFRVGDFYETFGDDAVKASRILGITLTKRHNGGAEDTPLAGFPHHSLDTYLPKLVRAGERVAICDQLEDPATAKGIVRRGVTELVTPGISFNDNVLDVRRNNYLAAVHLQKDEIGIALLDASTGEFLTTQGSTAYIEKLLQSFSPAEVLFCKKDRAEFLGAFGDKFNTYGLEDWVFRHDTAYPLLTNHFKTASLKGFGVENLSAGIVAAGVILHYLNETEHRQMGHIVRLMRLEEDRYVWLDKFTIRNLELVSSPNENGVPLIQILDQTTTPMGARLLRKWLVLPLKDRKPIEERLDTVQFFIDNPELAEAIEQHLKPIGDLERLISKVAVRRINPRELLHLKKALSQVVPIRQALLGQLLASEAPVDRPVAEENGQGVSAEVEVRATKSAVSNVLRRYAEQLNACESLVERIENTLRDDPPLLTNQGNMIKSGISPELDRLHQLAFSGKDFLIDLQNREIQRTGITSLKVAYNKVFGYYLEVTHAHKTRVPDDWLRKQTLVNAERYITPELKEYEDQILSAEEKIFSIESNFFNDLVLAAAEYVQPIQQNARVLAILDALASFARVARRQNYVRPTLRDDGVLDIRDGRHPVIEQQLPPGEPYIPNDIYLDNDSQQIIIITGPNMAGKSALLRQTALIVLMAQMGSFVPASAAEIGLVDKIFTRVGASDNLSRGESTFMVEMIETASILNNLSNRSLVLMDEIGRGTSTYDGVSIAWSITEYLHQLPDARPRTLFATHYHELNQLADEFPRIKNFNVSVKEAGNRVIFMRKLKPGGSEHSFGIHVAQMAGMPPTVVQRAGEILIHLEKDHLNDGTRNERPQERLRDVPKSVQATLFEADPRLNQLRDSLTKLDINTLTPIEALLKLNDLKRLVSES
ncbi:MAG: DNA mismatch repair protein MutS [Cytophagaceae bacterium]|nr:DNA mismatch repair protein MutS [Cytophagaceae bacterium]